MGPGLSSLSGVGVVAGSRELSVLMLQAMPLQPQLPPNLHSHLSAGKQPNLLVASCNLPPPERFLEHLCPKVFTHTVQAP